MLANEQVDEEGRSWRSGALIERRTLTQWNVCTTKMSEKLLRGLDDVEISTLSDRIAAQLAFRSENGAKEMDRQVFRRGVHLFPRFIRSKTERNPHLYHTSRNHLRSFVYRPLCQSSCLSPFCRNGFFSPRIRSFTPSALFFSFAMLERHPSKSARSKSMDTNSPSKPFIHSLTSRSTSMSPTTCFLITAKER